MKPVYKLILGLIIICITSMTVISQNYTRWAIVGQKQIDFQKDKDIIPIKAKGEKFVAVRLGIQGSTVEMHHLSITFDDGDVQTVPLRKKFKPGSMSKIIDLRGGLRVIEKFEIHYIPDQHAKGKQVVELWARGGVKKSESNGQR